MAKSGVTEGELCSSHSYQANSFIKHCDIIFVFYTEAIKEFSDGDFHDDANLKCYMRCLFEDTKTIDENGEVHIERIHTHIDQLDEEIQHIARDLVNKCDSKPEGGDDCEKAFSYHKCWRLEDPKVDSCLDF